MPSNTPDHGPDQSQTPSAGPPGGPEASARARWWAAPLLIGGALAVLHLALHVAVNPPGLGTGPNFADERDFHLPTIRAFAEAWPTPNFSDYLSATTPLYHLTLAGASKAVGDSDTAMRLLSGVFPIVAASLLAAWIARRRGPLEGVALALPFAASPYLLASLGWAVPDAAAWLGVLGVILLTLRPRPTVGVLVAAAAAVLLLVLTRQIHLWAAALVWLAAWLGAEPSRRERADGDNTPGRLIPGLSELDLTNRLPRALIAGALTLPAFAAVAYFFNLWDGPVPPSFQSDSVTRLALVEAGAGAAAHTGPNPATPAFVLAMFGVFGPFFAVHLWPEARARLAAGPRALVPIAVGTALAMLIAILPETSFDKDEGRWSGLWNLAARLPAPAGRSVAIVGAAGLGGLFLTLALLGAAPRTRLVVALATLAFTVAQTANLQVWQRYFEPFVLLVLALLVASSTRRAPRLAVVGPVVLGLALGALTLLRVLR